MGWLEDLGNAVSSAVEAVADAVESVATATGQAAEDVVETVANGVADFSEALSDTVEKAPVIGGFLAGATAWIGGYSSEVIGLVGGIISGVLTIISGVVGGLIRIIGGIVTWNARLVIDGWADIGTAFAGAGMLIGGKILSTIQVLVFAQDRKRRLTRGEMALLGRVFRRSIALYNIRIVEGRTGLFGINNRSFTLGNTIYLVGEVAAQNPALLVHESTHAWQYQHRGARYAMDAVWAQNYVLPSAYDWEAEIARGKVDWVDFNLEAQAEFLEDVYTLGKTVNSFGQTLSSGDGVFFDGGDEIETVKFVVEDANDQEVDHTGLANDALTFIRGRINWRPSQFLFG